MGKRDAQFDPNFKAHEDVERLIENDTWDHCDTVVVGLMLREIGLSADKHIFGMRPQLDGLENKARSDNWS